jgi:two-component system, cell cycle sensor histidine kinase and response regulator CckA
MNGAMYLRPGVPPAEPAAGPNLNLEAIGRLASGVAHDFNNLLTGIMLYCDLILEEVAVPGRRVPDRDRLRHAADEIRSACERGAALIQQLMVVARPPATEPDSVSWNETIMGMGNLLRRLIGESIEIIPDLAGDLKAVPLSPSRAQQVVLNLVLNARDAMPEGGKIVLQTRNYSLRSRRKGRDQVEFSVTDTGCGMDAVTQARAFEPFFTTKPPGRGNGVGLATVQGIIAKAGGRIQVESKPARGTCVLINLPPSPSFKGNKSQRPAVPRQVSALVKKKHSAKSKRSISSLRSSIAALSSSSSRSLAT